MDLTKIKAVKAVSAIAPLAFGISLLTPGAAHAATGMVQLDQVATQQLPYYFNCASWCSGYLGPVDTSPIVASNVSAEPEGTPTTTLGDTWYIGSATLTNDSDRDQTLSSASFSKEIKQTLSTSVTNGVQLGAKVIATVNFGPVQAGGELSTTVNFSSTDTESTTTGETYMAPPQNIFLPAHTQADVSVTLQQVDTTGSLHLRADLSGMPTTQVSGFQGELADILGPNTRYGPQKVGAPALPDGITVDTVNKTVHFDGEATYTATYGTNMYVDVSYSPEGNGDSKAIATTPSSYRYTIATPQDSAAH
ncbi:ETX/MTX2 family pore-forming toxin [Kitasatospora sp. GAS204B]|uniref:ETX/MTX2 family pore-forming toxin n=1 Tax=unclassified Kitasatospora TaxID=2633591 RepID=UPI0024734275|nr:ETX/MTX2 family pore-forming toxin [Kitasatospora sp. GAS204B]MDH6122865.1 hypothetical protein [Kitasatospora sp. GAS204B]